MITALLDKNVNKLFMMKESDKLKLIKDASEAFFMKS
jgi:hypothetical protein